MSAIDRLRAKVALSNPAGVVLSRWDRLDNVLVYELDRPIQDTIIEPDMMAHLQSRGVETAGQAAVHRLLNSRDERIVAKMLGIDYGRAPRTVVHRTETPNLSEVPTSELLQQLNLTAVEQAEVVDETPNPSNNNDIDESSKHSLTQE